MAPMKPRSTLAIGLAGSLAPGPAGGSAGSVGSAHGQPGQPGQPVLASAADLDVDRVSDVCIGLPDGPGGRFRVLHRLRAPLSEAMKLAARTAAVLAGANHETLLDPQCRPAAIRISDEGSRMWLDYDVGVVDGRPRSSRPLRLVMLKSPTHQTPEE